MNKKCTVQVSCSKRHDASYSRTIRVLFSFTQREAIGGRDCVLFTGTPFSNLVHAGGAGTRHAPACCPASCAR